jgi:SIR2-like domain
MADTVILLGAGASSPAGVPTAFEMTEKMLQLIRDKRLARALKALAGGLQMQPMSDRETTTLGIDIERVLNAATLLSERGSLEFAPFVGTWHPVIEQLERVDLSRGEAQRIAERAFSKPMPSMSSMRTVDKASHAIKDYLSKVLGDALGRVANVLNTRRDGDLFRELVDNLTASLIQLTYLRQAENLAYLDPMLEPARCKAVTIATLNYDNGVELRADRLGVPITTRLDEFAAGAPVAPLDVGVELLKLHGSVTWTWTGFPHPEERGPEVRAMTPQEMEGLSHPSLMTGGIGRQLAVRFGGTNKLTGEGPFLDLLFTFRSRLLESKSLLVAGYSFRDPHIDHIIRRWLSGDPARRLVIVEREGYDAASHPFLAGHRMHRVEVDVRGIERALAPRIAELLA